MKLTVLVDNNTIIDRYFYAEPLNIFINAGRTLSTPAIVPIFAQRLY